MLYLYAITDHPDIALPAALTGLADAPIRSLKHGEIAAIVSETDTAQITPSEIIVWQFEAVLEALMAERTLLPVRFGTIFSSEAAVREVLTTYHDDFIDNLAQVRGRVEISVRALSDDDDDSLEPALPLPMPVSSGRDYLMARLAAEKQTQARQQRAEEMAACLNAPLSQLATASSYEVLTTPRMILSGTYLIEASRVEAFKESIASLSATYEQLAFLCTGPWPPYSFVTVGTLASEW